MKNKEVAYLLIGFLFSFYILREYFIKAVSIYNGNQVGTITGMDAFVIEILSFVFLAIFFGGYVLISKEKMTSKKIMTLVALMISLVLFVILIEFSFESFLTISTILILVSATYVKFQIALNNRKNLRVLIYYPFIMFLSLFAVVYFDVLNESLSKHLIQQGLDNANIFSDSLWAMIYYFSIGYVLPVFLIVRKNILTNRSR